MYEGMDGGFGDFLMDLDDLADMVNGEGQSFREKRVRGTGR